MASGEEKESTISGEPELRENGNPGREQEAKKKGPIKRGRRSANIRTQVAKVIDPATRCTEINTRLKDVE